MASNTILRSVNELSLATWFGGSLMGAIGLRRAAATGGEQIKAEDAGWNAWQPVQTAAVLAQLGSGAGLTIANRGRYLLQGGVARTSLARTGVTGAALAATLLAARSGEQLSEASSSGATADEIRRLQSRTRLFQALVPALTGTMIVFDALMGEQQRPQQVARGVVSRLIPGR